MENKEAKEVYVVYGNVGTFATEDPKPIILPCVENLAVFDNYESAYEYFRDLVWESYHEGLLNYYHAYPRTMTDEELFADYNLPPITEEDDDEDAIEEARENNPLWYDDVCWSYQESDDSSFICWEVYSKYPLHVTGTVCRPGIYMCKTKLEK